MFTEIEQIFSPGNGKNNIESFYKKFNLGKYNGKPSY